MGGIRSRRDVEKGPVSRSILNALRCLAVLLLVLLALRIAWLSDDALITLRSALNITHGWGPGYNATEAVQAYTHPLWFLLWVALGGLTSQWVIGILILSVALTGAAVAILAWQARTPARIIVAIGLLALSNAFMEYATSGLENPLSYVLVGVLFLLSVTASDRTSRLRGPLTWALAVGLATAALILTRFDLALLVLPVLALLAWQRRGDARVIAIALLAFALPLIAWFAWSKATYDTWLPNTFEAKRNLDIPAGELVVQGIRYLVVTFERDPVTALLLFGGIALAFAAGSTVGRAWAVGTVLYLAYVVWIGGDFMAGRFVAVPVYVAALLLATVPLAEVTDRVQEPLASVAAALAVLVAAGLVAAGMGAVPTTLADAQAPRWDDLKNAGISDERGVYVQNARSLQGFLDNLGEELVGDPFRPVGDRQGLNRDLRYLDWQAKSWPTTTTYIGTPSEVAGFCGFMGTVGIVTGPTTHLIDGCALSDRYLASKPYQPVRPFAWKPGHFERQVPDGYVEAIQSNDPSKLRDPAERFYVTRLWSSIRPQPVPAG